VSAGPHATAAPLWEASADLAAMMTVFAAFKSGSSSQPRRPDMVSALRRIRVGPCRSDRPSMLTGIPGRRQIR
jgi:hypothetical protein